MIPRVRLFFAGLSELDNAGKMYHRDGMEHAMHRTTFSLDEKATQRLKTLSRRWNVSQAEVIRRALEAAEALPAEDSALAALEAYRTQGGLLAERAEGYLKEWARDRDDGAGW